MKKAVEFPAAPPGASLAYHLLVLAAFTSPWNGVFVGPLQPVDLLLVLSVIVGLPTLITRPIGPPRWIAIPASTILVLVIAHYVAPTSELYMQSRYSLAPLDAPVTTAVKWLVALFLLPTIAVNLVAKGRKPATPIAYAWAFGSAASGLVATTDFFGLSSVGQSLIGYEAILGRQSGLASHVNNLGFGCAIATPVAMHMLFHRRVGAGMVTLLLLSAGALFSGSRGAQIGLVLAILLALVATRGARRATIPAAYLFSFLFSATLLMRPSLFTVGQFGELLRFTDANAEYSRQSDQGRALIAQQALNDFRENPIIGIGFDVLNHAHNIYLQVAASGGLLLFLSMTYFWMGVLTAGWRLARRVDPLSAFLAMSVTVWLITGLVENQLTDRYLYVPVALIATLHMVAIRPETEPTSTPHHFNSSGTGVPSM